METQRTAPRSRREWTIRKVTDRGWRIYRGDRHVGLLFLWRSGYVEWSFAAGEAPSKSTQRRLLAEVSQ